jgi:hypothetical protein
MRVLEVRVLKRLFPTVATPDIDANRDAVLDVET